MREHIPSKEQFSGSISMCMSTLELHLGEERKCRGAVVTIGLIMFICKAWCKGRMQYPDRKNEKKN